MITATISADNTLKEGYLKIARGGVYGISLRFLNASGQRELLEEGTTITLRVYTPDGTEVDDIESSTNWLINEGSETYEGQINTAGPIAGHLAYSTLQADIRTVGPSGDTRETPRFAVLFGDYANLMAQPPSIVGKLTPAPPATLASNVATAEPLSAAHVQGELEAQATASTGLAARVDYLDRQLGEVDGNMPGAIRRVPEETSIYATTETVQETLLDIGVVSLIGGEQGTIDEFGIPWDISGVTADAEALDFKSPSPSLQVGGATKFQTDHFGSDFFANGFSMGGFVLMNEPTAEDKTVVPAIVRDPESAAFVAIILDRQPSEELFRNVWTIRYQARAADGTIIADRFFDRKLVGYVPLYFHANVENDRIALYVDGEFVGTDDFSRPTPALGRAAFLNNASEDVFHDSLGQNLYIADRAYAPEEIERIMAAWLGNPVKLTPEMAVSYYDDAFAGREWFKARVEVTEPVGVAMGVLGDRFETRQTGRSAAVTAQIGDNTGRTTISSARLFGRYKNELNETEAFIDGIQYDTLTNPGRYTVSYAVQEANDWTTRGVSIMSGERHAPFVGEVKDGFSAPNAAYYGGSLFTCHSSIFVDTRWVGKHVSGKPSTFVKTDDGRTLGDVNHAGMCLVPTENGVLQIVTGHATAKFRCFYFADGVLENPTVYELGQDDSQLSYPHAVALNDGRVAVYTRGSIGNAPNGHYALLTMFRPEDGSEFTQDVAWAHYSNRWRAYMSHMQHANSNGKEYICFLQNPRSWNNDYHDIITAISYNVTDDVWHGPNGVPFGEPGVKGTDAAPRANGSLLEVSAAEGGWRLADRGAFDQIETDVECAHFDESLLPVMSGKCMFTRSNGHSAGGYSDSIQTYKLSFTGDLYTESPVRPLFGQSIAAFSSQKVIRYEEVDYYAILSRYARPATGVDYEMASPYSFGWKGAEYAEVRRWADDSLVDHYRLGEVPVASLQKIAGGSGREFSGYATIGWTHPTIHNCKMIRFDIFNGIQRDVTRK